MQESRPRPENLPSPARGRRVWDEPTRDGKHAIVHRFALVHRVVALADSGMESASGRCRHRVRRCPVCSDDEVDTPCSHLATALPASPPRARARAAGWPRLAAARASFGAPPAYGSRARGTHRPESDADVAVLLRGEQGRFLSTKLAMADVAFDVLLETGILASPLPVWLEEWEHPEDYPNPALLHSIGREGVRL